MQANRFKKPVAAYAFLEQLFRDLLLFNLLPYDDVAEQVYQNMTPDVKRIGTQDCRVAASAMSRGSRLQFAGGQPCHEDHQDHK